MSTPVSYEEGQAAMTKIYDAVVQHLPETVGRVTAISIAFKGVDWAPELTVSYFLRPAEAADLAHVMKTFHLGLVAEATDVPLPG